MKKISGFTLLELLIGMIISSIVIGFCYTGYGIIYKQYLNYIGMRKQITVAMQLNSTLNTDFINAASATLDMNKLILISENKIQLYYEFKDNYILREDRELTDTFLLSAENIVPIYLMEQEQQPSALVTNFSFDAAVLGESEHFHFVKEYSAETIVNTQMQHLQNN